MGIPRPFIERLSVSVEKHGHALCAGLDPWWNFMPTELTAGCVDLESRANACQLFCEAVIDRLVGHVGIVKPQSAFFEQYGFAGVAAFDNVARYAKSRGLLVIGDVKRGDIGSTASAYAQAFFRIDESSGESLFDAITVNPLFGSDGVRPFLELAKETHCGIFLLLRTSNPSSTELQELNVDGRPFYMHLADLIRGWIDELDERTSDSLVGVVVGATQDKVVRQIRQRLPRSWFLMPGVGAQGAGAEACAAAVDQRGKGALVSVSRGLLYPWRAQAEGSRASDWKEQLQRSVKEWAEAAKRVGKNT